MDTSEVKFKSTLNRKTVGNGKVLIVAGGNILSKGENGEEITEPFLTGTANALRGTYEGSAPNKYDETKLDQKMRLEDGTLVIIRETANIRRGFANVTEGELVQLVYGGKRKMTKGANAGMFVHDFDVQCAVTSEE